MSGRPLNNSYRQFFSFSHNTSHILTFPVSYLKNISRIWQFLPVSTVTTQVQIIIVSCLDHCKVSLLCLCPLQTMNSIVASKPAHVTHSSKSSHCFFKVAWTAPHLWPHLLLINSQTSPANWLLCSYDNLSGMHPSQAFVLGCSLQGGSLRLTLSLPLVFTQMPALQWGHPRLPPLKFQLPVPRFPISFLCFIFTPIPPSNILRIFFCFHF